MERCIICCEQDWDDCFEIQEFVNKEQYVFKVSWIMGYFEEMGLFCDMACRFLQGEETGDTQLWFKTLQFYTQSLGGWRRRRKGLGNIMIDPNVAASVDNTYYLEAEEEVRRRRSSSWTREEAAAAVEGASALPPTEG